MRDLEQIICEHQWSLKTAKRAPISFHAQHANDLKPSYLNAVKEHGGFNNNKIGEEMHLANQHILASKMTLSEDPGECWKNVQRFQGCQKDDYSTRPPLLDENDEELTDTKEVAECLARHFARNSKNPPNSKYDCQSELRELKDEMDRNQQQSPSWKELSRPELIAAIAESKSNKCADQFGLRAEHFKLLDDDCWLILTPLFDHYFRNAIFCKHWKTSRVTPLPKPKRNKQIRSSFRPVSITSIIARIMERVIAARVNHVWEKHRQGSSQFAFRRGIGTSSPLHALSMFIIDGFKQHVNFVPWDAENPQEDDKNQRNKKGEGSKQHQRKSRQTHHVTLLLSIDCNSAFDRGIPPKVIRRLREMGLEAEARWICQYFMNRKLRVFDRGEYSSRQDLDRGFPQGSCLAALLWSIFIDDLIFDCEQYCQAKISPGVQFHPGSIAYPLFFADDINFAIRGFNPSSILKQANELMAIVREWSEINEIPMSKLNAIWITHSVAINNAIQGEISKNHNNNNDVPLFQNQQIDNNLIDADNNNNNKEAHAGISAGHFKEFAAREIVFNNELKTVARVGSMRLLGVIYDSWFNFHDHVNHVVNGCNSCLWYLENMKKFMPAEKLKILYTGLVLSRILFACESWFPFISSSDRSRLQQVHYRGCRIITGLPKTVHTLSCCAEAGFPDINQKVKEEILAITNRLLHLHPPLQPRPRHHSTNLDAFRVPLLNRNLVFGMNWLLHLLLRYRSITASLRPQFSNRVNTTVSAPVNGNYVKYFPKDQYQTRSLCENFESKTICSSRDLMNQFKLLSFVPLESRRYLSAPHPLDPSRLAAFSKNVHLFTTPPGGYSKPSGNIEDWQVEIRQKITAANRQRLLDINKDILTQLNNNNLELQKICVAYGDASRDEDSQSCAGAFRIYRHVGFHTHFKSGTEVPPWISGFAPGGPLACIYSAELETTHRIFWTIYLHRAEIIKSSRFIVHITDCLSSLLCLKKTSIRKMNYQEQCLSHLIYELAEYGFVIYSAFVFSHLGIVGNELADADADRACKLIGRLPPKTRKEFVSGISPCYGYSEYDTFRPVYHNLRRRYGSYLMSSVKSFRFRSLKSASPSDTLPREARIPRQDESLIFNARLGLFPQLGGFFPNQHDSCPLCGQSGALGRDGMTITHLLRDCSITADLRDSTKGVSDFQILWDCPPAAVLVLREVLFRALCSNLENSVLTSSSKQKLLQEFFNIKYNAVHKYTSYSLIFNEAPPSSNLSFFSYFNKNNDNNSLSFSSFKIQNETNNNNFNLLCKNNKISDPVFPYLDKVAGDSGESHSGSSFSLNP